MSTPQIWIVILGGMVVTYATRLSFLILVPPEHMPLWLRRGLRFAAPAVLAAIIVPAVAVAPPGYAGLLHPRLIVGCVAAVVAWRTRNTWFTIAVGMGLLWVIEFLLARV